MVRSWPLGVSSLALLDSWSSDVAEEAYHMISSHLKTRPGCLYARMSQYCDTRSLVLLHHVCCSVLRRCLLVSTRSLTSLLSTPSVVSISFQSYSLAFSLLIISGCLRLRLLWNFAKISVMSVAQLWRFFWQKFCLIIRKFWWWGFRCPMLVQYWCSDLDIHVVGAFSHY